MMCICFLLQHHVITSEAAVTERVSVQVTNPLGPDSAALQLDSLAVLDEAIRGNVSVLQLFSSQLVYHVCCKDLWRSYYMQRESDIPLWNKWCYVQYLESMQGMQCVAGWPDMFPFGPYTYIHIPTLST